LGISGSGSLHGGFEHSESVFLFHDRSVVLVELDFKVFELFSSSCNTLVRKNFISRIVQKLYCQLNYHEFVKNTKIHI
jgi:hypothetical protein